MGLLFLAIMLVLGGCGKEKAEQVEQKNNEDVESDVTISEVPVTPFENIDGKTAMKLYPKD